MSIVGRLILLIVAALGITKYNLLLLSLARQLQISRHISFVATYQAARKFDAYIIPRLYLLRKFTDKRIKKTSLCHDLSQAKL